MNKRSAFIFFFFIVVVSLYAQEVKDYIPHGKEVLSLLQEAKGEEVYRQMDEQSKAAITVPVLNTIWASLKMQAGDYKEVHSWQSQQLEDKTLINAVLVFEKLALEYRVTFDSDGQISGLWFLPVRQEVAAIRPQSNDYFSEKEVIVKTGEYELPGFLTLSLSSKSSPCVILVHGSGPNDRNERIYDNFLFRDLAHGLAKAGVASVRYDKRTYVYKNEYATKADITLQEEVIDDVLSAIQLCMAQQEIDENNIFVIGHSLGGMLAPEIAAQSDKLKGIIMMAANASPLEKVILYQLLYLNEINDEIDMQDQIHKFQLQVENMKKVGTSEFNEEIGYPFHISPAYWEDLNQYDQIETAKQLTLPILLMNGEKDYQVNMSEFNLWKEVLRGKENVTFISYPGLSHLFMEAAEIPSPKDYEKPGKVPDYVIGDIAEWINKQIDK